jgi:diguanylate cyclase (GGDEF)-like protein/PAS domain S-box-containing protein
MDHLTNFLTNKIVESEQRYRCIIDNNLDAIMTISHEGKIQDANPAAALMTGYAEKQMLNRSIYDIINDHDLEKFKLLLEKTCSGTAVESLDCKLIHSKGHLLIVQIKTIPIIVHGKISGLYVIFKDLSEQSKNMKMVKFLAFHDQLTGLLNRRALLEHLNQQIFALSKKRQEFALISMDLDRFKFLNDTLGHLAGDEILKRVADRLLQFQNEKCFIYRLGGDEFNILLLPADRKTASTFTSKVFSVFSQSFYFNSQEYFISPSIGISMYPHDGKDAEMLIKNADEALFRVKEQGKAHFQFYRTDMSSVFSNIITMETHLRKAIAKNELTLFYQPQIDLATGKAQSFEALLRWNNREFGSISPAVFIPLAEDTGLIISIGYWVIEKTCQHIHTWHEM